jgi:Flp pilus assembly protein CpaB
MRAARLALLGAACLAALLAGISLGRAKTDREVVTGWNLAPTVAFARDLPAGAVLAREDLVERDLPEQMVSDSNVPMARESEAVGQRLMASVVAGEPLLWAHLVCDHAAKTCEWDRAAHAPAPSGGRAPSVPGTP